MLSPLLRHLLFLPAVALLAQSAAAQIPNTLRHSIPAPWGGSHQGHANLGSSVAVDEASGLAVAGAPNDDFGGMNSGVVKVFDSTTGVMLHFIANPTPAVSDGFGNDVAISGTRIIVGAALDDTGALDAGRVYVYDLASATPTVPVITLNQLIPAARGHFGTSVAVSGTRVVVGAHWDGIGTYRAGSAYIFDLASPTPTVPVATLNNPAPAEDEYFGISVAVSGTHVVVGAYLDDTGALNGGIAYVYDMASATPTVPKVTLNNPSPAANDWFGGSVAVSGTRVVVGAGRDDTGASNAGSAYVYDLDGTTPTVPVATLNNPTPVAEDGFGFTLAISGTRIVAGARNDDTGADNSGSAYVYDLASATPTVPVATLNNPTPGWYDYFGNSVAISGMHIVVGAFWDHTVASNAGSAYVFDLASATPTVAVATLNNSGPAINDYFGTSMAMSGTRIVVGSYGDDTGGTNAGSAYVFDLASTTPTLPVFTINNPGPALDDNFGYSVAISGTRVVVGAYRDNTGANYTGIVYVYDLAGATPTVPVATLNNPTSTAGDYFGYSVAISGTRVVVGALNDDTGAEDTGSAYVYELAGTTPTVPVATLNNPIPGEYARFGCSMAISGTRVVVGAYGNDISAYDAGSAYVYDLTSTTPTVPVATLKKPGPVEYDRFGYSMAISGPHVVVGAYKDSTGAGFAGSAYVFDLDSTAPTVPVAILHNPGPALLDYFGISVAISGTRVVVGASEDDTGASNAGSAYVYDLASATPTVPVATLSNPSPAAGDYFGRSVAIDGVNVAIGAPWDDSIMADKGYAYVFGPHPLDQDSDGLRDAWELSYWPAITGHGPADDSDHDGVVELLELAFGLNPTLSDARGLPSATIVDNCLTMTITKQPGVAYQVQSAGTLRPGQPDSFSAASTTIVLNSDTTLTVRDKIPTSSAARRFLRVQVTAAP